MSHRRGWMGSSLDTVKVVKVIVKAVTILTYDEGRPRCLHWFSIQAAILIS